MKDYIDVTGASGAHYRFMRFREGRPLSPMGGNYIYARFTGERFEMLYAGEAQNLLTTARERWPEALTRFQATDLYSRLNISERVRQLEHTDIVGHNHPPMNTEPDRKAG